MTLKTLLFTVHTHTKKNNDDINDTTMNSLLQKQYSYHQEKEEQ